MKMQHIRKLFFFVLFGFFLGILPMSKVIAAELKTPQIAIKNASNQLKIKLQEEGFIQDFEQINVFVEEVINPHVDFNRISALVLGKLWKKATKEEKTRFRDEFKTLLVRTYSRAFLDFKEWSVRFLPLKINSETKKVIVKTEILQPGIQPLSINYRMILRKGQWKVYDIMIEGVSLVTNYRTSIKGEYKKSGSIKAVIDKLAKRNVAALAVKNNS